MVDNKSKAIREGGRPANKGQRDSTDIAQASGQGTRRKQTQLEEDEQAAGAKQSPLKSTRK
jgi:hypothetical protein